MPSGDTSNGQSGAVAPPSSTLHQITPPKYLDLKHSGEIAENWKLWKEKYNNYFVISRLDRETPEFQLAMFKHTIGDDALKVIKTFNYAEGENSSDWRVVMGKMEKHCIGEVNEIYERYCFNMRDKLPTESVDSFVAELRNLAKTCNFCDCLRDSLIRDRIVLVFNSKHNRNTKTREDTREQAPPGTRVETFDQPPDPLSSVPDAPKSPNPLQAPRSKVHASPSAAQASTGLCAFLSLRTLSKELNFIN